ncbi:MAG: type II secretion system protein N [Pseudomonadota bacterium]
MVTHSPLFKASIFDFRTSSIGASVPFGVMLIAVVILGLLCARFFWLVTAGATLSTSSPAPSPMNSVAASQSYVSVLQRRSPFRPMTIEAETRVDSVPDTQLRLTLHGVRTGANEEGVAIISNESGAQRRYRAGEEIEESPGVELQSIYADGVLLTRNGRVERLPINPDDRVSAIKSVEDVEAEARSAPATIEGPDVPAPNVEIKNAGSRLSHSELATLFQTLRFEQAPDVAGGGVMVFPLSSEGPFKKSGLRSRDIVQSIDGMSVGASADYPALLQQLESQDRAVIMLLRGDQQWRLTVTLSE